MTGNRAFLGVPPKKNRLGNTVSNAQLGSVVSITRSGTIASVSGIAGVDGDYVKPGWRIEDQMENLVFDSRARYLRKLLKSQITIPIPARGKDSLTTTHLITSITSEFSNSFCVGKVAGVDDFGIYTGLCSQNSSRLLFFASTTVSVGTNAYKTDVYLIEQYGGAGSGAYSIPVDVTVFVW